ncbi:thiamine transporter membrane protein [Candidatus Regiella insecticola 5.15]|uniref:Thiamine transporter membrane protein n=1 Tax=Candidatus Regiella insecticola 5.15 TaxID=1005043 RepID=G2GYZ5_9ENTR|nr:thiamine transporter membrane protein [Candidatus Regiella insecticola 5.15]
MAKRRQSLIPGWLLPGLFTASLLFGLIILIFTTLWQHAQTSNWQNIWHDSYLWHVIRFTFWQALLSTLLSILPAIFLARALYRRRFPGRQWLLRLSAMTLVLPVLVALFGILTVYGNQGWLAQLSAWLGIEYRFSIYGLPGILLAHTFFNCHLQPDYYYNH